MHYSKFTISLIIIGLFTIGFNLVVYPVSASGDWFECDSSMVDSYCGDSGNTLASALDGREFWRHSQKETHWFILNLGDMYNISGVEGRSNDDFDPVDCDLYVSNNTTSWTLVAYSMDFSDSDNFIEHSFAEFGIVDNILCQYVKLEIVETEESIDGPISFGSARSPMTIFGLYGEVYVPPEDDIVVELQNISYYQTGQDIIVNTTIVQGYCANLSLRYVYSSDYNLSWIAENYLADWNTTAHTGYSWTTFDFPMGVGWYKLFVRGYDNDSYNYSGDQTICYPVQLPLPLGGGVSEEWNLVSLPKDEEIAKTLVRFVNDTHNYTWNEAVTNNVVLNFLYGWFDGHYTLNDTFLGYKGYWIYLYKDDYSIWVNTTGLSSGGEYTEDDVITSLVVFGSIMALGCVSLLNRKRNKN